MSSIDHGSRGSHDKKREVVHGYEITQEDVDLQIKPEIKFDEM